MKDATDVFSHFSGYRIRLHFDGYSDNYDFWVNADSMDIFPAGWCEKNGHRLHAPRGYTADNFNWSTYLKQCRAQAAPRNLFSNKTGSVSISGISQNLHLWFKSFLHAQTTHFRPFFV